MSIVDYFLGFFPTDAGVDIDVVVDGVTAVAAAVVIADVVVVVVAAVVTMVVDNDDELVEFVCTVFGVVCDSDSVVLSPDELVIIASN